MNQNQINRLYKVATVKMHGAANREPGERAAYAAMAAQDKAEVQARQNKAYLMAMSNHDGSEGTPFYQMTPEEFNLQEENLNSALPVPDGASALGYKYRNMIADVGINGHLPVGGDFLIPYLEGPVGDAPQPTNRHMTRQGFMAQNPGFVEGNGSPAPAPAPALAPALAPAAASKSGFDINKFIAIIKDRARQISDMTGRGAQGISDMAGRGAQGISNLAQDRRVQIGAGIGAAGLAGYGIYKHLSKKDKKKDRAYA